MSMLTLELGEQAEPRACECCGRDNHVVWGYLYRNDVAYGAYFAAWSDGHPDAGVRMAIGLGTWGDDTTEEDRSCVHLLCLPANEKLVFIVLDPEDATFPQAEGVLGRALSRTEAVGAPGIPNFFRVAEAIVGGDPRVRERLIGEDAE